MCTSRVGAGSSEHGSPRAAQTVVDAVVTNYGILEDVAGMETEQDAKLDRQGMPLPSHFEAMRGDFSSVHAALIHTALLSALREWPARQHGLQVGSAPEAAFPTS